jgi:hypothetical protein
MRGSTRKGALLGCWRLKAWNLAATAAISAMVKGGVAGGGDVGEDGTPDDDVRGVDGLGGCNVNVDGHCGEGGSEETSITSGVLEVARTTSLAERHEEAAVAIRESC